MKGEVEDSESEEEEKEEGRREEEGGRKGQGRCGDSHQLPC